MSDDTINRRLRSGSLVRLHEGVFVFPAGMPVSFTQRVFAAVLAAGAGAAASHRSAARLTELGEFTHRGVELDGPIEISVRAKQRPRLAGVTVYRVSYLPPEHVFERAGIRITNRARTVCDLAGVLSGDDLELVLDEALKRRRVKHSTLVATLATMPRNTKGAGVLRRLLEVRRGGTARVESPFEKELQVLLTNAGFEGWEPQYRSAGCRVDVAFPREKLAVQADSYLHHSSRADWAADHRRMRDLVQAGWRVFPVTKEDFQKGNELVVRLRAALASGGSATTNSGR